MHRQLLPPRLLPCLDLAGIDLHPNVKSGTLLILPSHLQCHLGFEQCAVDPPFFLTRATPHSQQLLSGLLGIGTSLTNLADFLGLPRF